jgi:hypothetical protein
MAALRKFLPILLIVHMATACAADTPPPAQAASGLSTDTDTTAMDDESVISHFQQFYRDSVLPLPDKTADRQAVANLIEQPQLPPSIRKTSCQDLATQLQDNPGAAALQDLVLYGQPDLLQQSSECLLIVYDGLLSGGVSACRDVTTNEYLLVWMQIEG